MFYKNLVRKILHKIGYKLEKVNSKIKLPAEFSYDELNIIKSIEDYTMTGRARIISLRNLYKDVINRNIEGDFVECGVWKGGNLIFIQKLNELYKQERNIYGFDTFKGMTNPSKFDIDHRNNFAKNLLKNTIKKSSVKNIWAYCDIQTVQHNIDKLTKINQIKLIEGDVNDTLNIDKNLPKKISLLRLDTDFYDSTKIELEILYPRLCRGGVLIIDDYGHFKGCKKAVDEFFKHSDIVLHYIDYSARYMIKK